MRNKEYNLRHIAFRTSLICCLCVGSLVLNGCTPLRKKFVRKKKEDRQTDQRFIPVLDPVDYPEKVQSVEENYKYHYSLWKVWNKDLIQVLSRDGSEKRQKYLLSQSIEQLKEMQNSINDRKLTEFGGLLTELESVRQEYTRPPSMRNKFLMKSKIERNAKKIRTGFTPSQLFPRGE